MKTQDLTTGSIALHVRNLALPSSIGLFFQTMYNVVDSFYAGQVSTTGLAALGISFPVYLLVLATSGGLSRGTSALLANAIGANQPNRQKKLVYQGLSLALLVGVVMTFIGSWVAKPLFQILGASGDYLQMALQYMLPIFYGSIFFVTVNVCNGILVATGDSKTFGGLLIVGFFLNLVLDPWLMYGGFGVPAMGIAGIAWATVIIQVFGCFWMLSVVVRRGLISFEKWDAFVPDMSIVKEILIQAIPASFNIMSVALGYFAVTWLLNQFGESTVAAFGVTTRIEQIGLMPTFGLYAAIMALVGQNNGARNFSRVQESMRVCNLIGGTLAVATSILIVIFSRPLMRIFTSEPDVIDIGVHCLLIMMMIQWCYVLTSTHLAFLQAIKRPFYGFLESVLRKILLPLGLYAAFASLDWGVDAVWYGIAGGNFLMTIVTIIFAQSVLRRITTKAT